jgi:hypothetical protein
MLPNKRHPAAFVCSLTTRMGDFPVVPERNALSTDLEDARIMAFDYNAAAALRRSTAYITDHTKDLLSSLMDKRGCGEVNRI